MRRNATTLLVVYLLLGATCLPGQELSADTFLDNVSAHPVGDQAEKDQCLRTYIALNAGPASEVERALPSILEHVRSGNETHVRGYAVTFLLGIAIRSDGRNLLSSHSADIASLLFDADPQIQHVAIAITDSAIDDGNSATFVPALAKAMLKASPRQHASVPAAYDPANDDAANIAALLLRFGSGDPAVVAEIHAFLTRSDLTPDARIAALNGLCGAGDLPEEISQDLLHFYADPDLHVRVQAILAFANSGSKFYTTNFHNEARKYVEQIAADEKVNPKLRQLAKDALAGHTPLNPNIDDRLVANPGLP